MIRGSITEAEPRDVPRPASIGPDRESEKERADRQLIELLTELRVALPGAQVLLGFLLTVPFATRFGQATHLDRVALFVCLLFTAVGTILLMAPSVYHRMRWRQGGKEDVIRVAHVLFVAGTAALAFGILDAIFLVADVVFGAVAGAVSAALVAAVVLGSWYLLPLTHGKQSRARAAQAGRR
jgi:O-antigen/teichoic acid export membrane protein